MANWFDSSVMSMVKPNGNTENASAENELAADFHVPICASTLFEDVSGFHAVYKRRLGRDGAAGRDCTSGVKARSK